jgi:hypothetical protein
MAIISISLPDDLLARMDVACGGVPRSAWVRRVIEQALASLVVVPLSAEEEAAVRAEGPGRELVAVSGRMNPIPDRGKAELALLLEALKVKPMTVREAADELGLPVMKVTAMEKALSQAGMIEYQAPGVMKAKPGL